VRSGEQAGGGERGEVVATNVYRYAMPLIRYNLGDVAVPSDAHCGCGLGLPIMRSLEGRTLNVVPLPNGRWFIGFLVILSEFPEIAKFQVVQKALDYFQVKIAPGPGYTPDVPTRYVRKWAAAFTSK
jgi:phenylacetate-CoA ligase